MHSIAVKWPEKNGWLMHKPGFGKMETLNPRGRIQLRCLNEGMNAAVMPPVTRLHGCWEPHDPLYTPMWKSTISQGITSR